MTLAERMALARAIETNRRVFTREVEIDVEKVFGASVKQLKREARASMPLLNDTKILHIDFARASHDKKHIFFSVQYDVSRLLTKYGVAALVQGVEQ